jgi:hypothetical protein
VKVLWLRFGEQGWSKQVAFTSPRSLNVTRQLCQPSFLELCRASHAVIPTGKSLYLNVLVRSSKEIPITLLSPSALALAKQSQTKSRRPTSSRKLLPTFNESTIDTYRTQASKQVSNRQDAKLNQREEREA